MSMILASFASLSTKTISGLLHPITLYIQIPKNFKTCISYLLLWDLFVSLIYPFQFCPHSCQCTYRATLLWRLHVVLTCCTHLLVDLHFFPSLCTSFTWVILMQSLKNPVLSCISPAPSYSNHHEEPVS